jgi:hypothetical protein
MSLFEALENFAKSAKPGAPPLCFNSKPSPISKQAFPVSTDGTD